MTTDVVFTIFLIFTGAAVLATLSLFARQTMLIAYILLGLIVGPFGAGLVADTKMVENVSHIGIMFLLFLLGLNLEPQKLLHLFRKTAVINRRHLRVLRGGQRRNLLRAWLLPATIASSSAPA